MKSFSELSTITQFPREGFEIHHTAVKYVMENYLQLIDANAMPHGAQDTILALDLQGYLTQQETSRGFFTWQTGAAVVGGIVLMAAAGRALRKRQRAVQGDEKLKLVREDNSQEETPLDRFMENLSPNSPLKLRLLM